MGENASHNRTILIRVLKALAPQRRNNERVTCLEVIRSSMQRLADDAVWQDVSAQGKSGTKKLSMREHMPTIMDTILLVGAKVMNTDTKAASSSLSTYLKNSASRASSKKAKELAASQQRMVAQRQTENGDDVHGSTSQTVASEIVSDGDLFSSDSDENVYSSSSDESENN